MSAFECNLPCGHYLDVSETTQDAIYMTGGLPLTCPVCGKRYMVEFERKGTLRAREMPEILCDQSNYPSESDIKDMKY